MPWGDSPYIKVCASQWAGFLVLFGLKTGMVFEGTTGVYVNVFIVSPQMNKNEVEIDANSK